MKKVLLSIIALLLLICSCHRRPVYPPQFYVADSLASVQPDSAISLLETLKADSPQWDKATQMYHSLLTVKARDKAYITHTSDSLMLSVLNYYEHGGDKHLLPEAYYYMGSTYRDMNDAPRALEYYQKALEVLPEGASPLRRYVNNQMGWLFYRQYLYDEALACYQRSFDNDSVLDNKVEMSSDLVNMGFLYGNRDCLDTALYYYSHAKSLVIEQKDNPAIDEIDSQIAYLYVEKGMFSEAKQSIQNPLKHVTPSNISNIYSIAGIIYHKLGIIDSASYYFNRLLRVGNIYGKQTAYEHLGMIAIQEDRMKDAVNYSNLYRVLTDSIHNRTATESIAQMNSLYNYQKALEEKEAIVEQNNTNRWIISLLCLLFIVIILGVFIFVRQVKLRRIDMQKKLEELELTKDLMRSVTEQSIAEKTDRINELEKQMMIIGDTNIELSKRIEDQQRIIQSQISQTEEKLNERDNMDEQLRKSEIYPHLLFLINTKRKLNKKDWDKLKETFQRISPIFMEHLLGSCVMNEVELEISLLCRIGISPSDIAGLLNFSRSHISFIRRGLYKKVFGKEGKPSKWDEYVYLL